VQSSWSLFPPGNFQTRPSMIIHRATMSGPKAQLMRMSVGPGAKAKGRARARQLSGHLLREVGSWEVAGEDVDRGGKACDHEAKARASDGPIPKIGGAIVPEAVGKLDLAPFPNQASANPDENDEANENPFASVYLVASVSSDGRNDHTVAIQNDEEERRFSCGESQRQNLSGGAVPQ